MAENDTIHFEKRGVAGIITLDKQRTLNALTDAMLSALNAQLDQWENDPGVQRIIIRSVPGKAFSAGGDIRHLYECGVRQDYDFDFFAREYRLNARIANLEKPYVALIDGIVMGGGVGVSFHGSHKIAGDNFLFAMPEVGIGFFPDVGASYLLSRLPGHVGLYLGLTGERVRQGDALALGLVDAACASQHLPALEAALADGGDIDDALASFSFVPDTGPIVEHADEIDRLFGGDTLDEIVNALNLAAAGSSFAAKTLDTLHQKSPTSLAIAFEQIRRGAKLDINGCMQMEFRILCRILPGQDFYEGIRAAIIDKDNRPAWQPDALSKIDPGEIERYFSRLGSAGAQQELPLP